MKRILILVLLLGMTSMASQILLTPDGSNGYPITGENLGRQTDFLVIYTPEFGPQTQTNIWGIELAVSQGVVQEIREYQDPIPLPIPRDGYVLSGHGASLETLRTFAVGDVVRIIPEREWSGPAPGIPVLMYHRISINPQGNPWDLHVDLFEEHLRYFKDQGYTTISMNLLLAYMKGEDVKLPPKPIVLTFDDGHEEWYHLVLPLAIEYQTHLVFFPIINQADRGVSGRLSWDQMRELVESGLVEIQSHSYNSHWQTEEDGVSRGVYVNRIGSESQSEFDQRRLEDLRLSRDRIWEETGQISHFIAWPYGHHTAQLVELAQQAGYLGMVTTIEGVNRRGMDPHYIRRIGVFPEDTVERLHQRITRFRPY